MDPILGNIIVGAVVALLAFLSGRSVLRSIKAELRGEGSCSGCGRCGQGASCGECRMCERLDELRRKKAEKIN